MYETNTVGNMPQGCNAYGDCPHGKKPPKGRTVVAIALGILAFLVVCYANFYHIDVEGYFGSFLGKHAVLIASIDNDVSDPDAEQIRSALKVGGYLELAANKHGAEFIRSIDAHFDMFAAADADGNFYIQPAVLNWISSHGWKLQQVLRGNSNEGNVEYVFVR